MCGYVHTNSDSFGAQKHQPPPGAGITGELPNSVGVNTETQVLCKTHEPSLQWGKFVFLFLCFVSKPTLALNF